MSWRSAVRVFSGMFIVTAVGEAASVAAGDGTAPAPIRMDSCSPAFVDIRGIRDSIDTDEPRLSGRGSNVGWTVTLSRRHCRWPNPKHRITLAKQLVKTPIDHSTPHL
jgi:hypothetical protein